MHDPQLVGGCFAVFVIGAWTRADRKRGIHTTWRTRHEGQDESQGWRLQLEQITPERFDS
jgi:hypothetical protein